MEPRSALTPLILQPTTSLIHRPGPTRIYNIFFAQAAGKNATRKTSEAFIFAFKTGLWTPPL